VPTLVVGPPLSNLAARKNTCWPTGSAMCSCSVRPSDEGFLLAWQTLTSELERPASVLGFC